MPPTGGFGGNTGVADAHNLVWKLASVLDGSAGLGLLDTYDVERRPVGEFTTEQAYTRYVLRLDPELGKDDIQPFVPDPPIELGHRYRSEAVVAESDNDDGAIHENPHEPSGRPGTRAPHVERNGGSTLDLFGRGFVVLSASERWRAAAEGVGVDAQPLGTAAADTYGTSAEGAVLVRPDGFIAWRARGEEPDEERVLRGALDRVLAR
jgi:hypothetical protein